MNLLAMNVAPWGSPMTVDGNAQHPGDMAAQLELALDNLQDVLAAADMTFANIVRLNVYTTDFDELLEHWARLTDRFGIPLIAL